MRPFLFGLVLGGAGAMIYVHHQKPKQEETRTFIQEWLSMDARRDAIAAKAMDELPVRAILKKNDMRKEMEYHALIRDLDDVKDSKDYTTLKRTLLRIRRSPCFNEKMQSEYDKLWMQTPHTLK